ncbi:hypothetical protein C6Y14_20665 [Streptomyces dioscori]|uniref:Uncharacterized protein n=1 Tax=Streptomyces dioscori TaxID=2109333 RepID=A0A2P8Q4N9_9ACTN|nr:hypothetical protein C6Y14_20665 [Streptomyces dioscori]
MCARSEAPWSATDARPPRPCGTVPLRGGPSTTAGTSRRAARFPCGTVRRTGAGASWLAAPFPAPLRPLGARGTARSAPTGPQTT